MKKLFIAFIGLTVLFTACGGDSAVKFNDTIIDCVDGAADKLDIVSGYIDDEDYETAVAYLDSVALFAQEGYAKVSELKYKSGEVFKVASLEYLKMIELDAVPTVRKVITLYQEGEATEDYDEGNSKYEEANNLINNLYERISEADDKLIAIQATFAKKNDLILE